LGAGFGLFNASLWKPSQALILWTYTDELKGHVDYKLIVALLKVNPKCN
jgi:hypothetical protein